MKVIIVFFVALAIANCYPWTQQDDYDHSISDLLFDRIYRQVLLKAKRSPSMGLSLAQYVAGAGGQDNYRLHFLNPQASGQAR